MFWLTLALTVAGLTQLAHGDKVDTECDIIVYGATPAGCAAAYIAALQDNPRASVCLLEPSAFLGGMMTAGGIGLRDTANFSSIFGDPRAFASQWAKLNAEHYGAKEYVLQPDVVVGNRSLWTLLLSVPNKIRIFLEEELAEMPGSVGKEGSRLVNITTVNAARGVTTTWRAAVFVDASYDGDLVMWGNITYTYGRESRMQYGEALAGVQPFNHFQNFLVPVDPTYANGSVLPYVSADSLPPVGSADTANMPYSYRACLTKEKSNQVPFYAPDGYSADDFVLLQRYLDSFNISSGPDITDLAGIYPYKNYPSGPSREMKYDLCEGGHGPQGQTSPFTTDQPDINAGYVPAPRAGKRLIAQRVRCAYACLCIYVCVCVCVCVCEHR
jgi:hypothetical protein